MKKYLFALSLGIFVLAPIYSPIALAAKPISSNQHLKSMVINLNQKDPVMFRTMIITNMCANRGDTCLATSQALIGIGFTRIIIRSATSSNKITINDNHKFGMVGDKVADLTIDENFYLSLYQAIKDSGKDVKIIHDITNQSLIYIEDGQSFSAPLYKLTTPSRLMQ